MATVRKITIDKNEKNALPVEENAHDGGGALGMTAGGVAGAFVAGAAAAAAAGASTGAIAGSVAGPIGAVAGAALGGAIGGIVGEDIARKINPTDEEKYWETAYRTRPYFSEIYSYEAYRPAYRYGVDTYLNNPDASFDTLEPTLKSRWQTSRGTSTLDWNDARPAAQDAYLRLKDKYKK